MCVGGVGVHVVEAINQESILFLVKMLLTLRTISLLWSGLLLWSDFLDFSSKSQELAFDLREVCVWGGVVTWKCQGLQKKKTVSQTHIDVKKIKEEDRTSHSHHKLEHFEPHWNPLKATEHCVCLCVTSDGEESTGHHTAHSMPVETRLPSILSRTKWPPRDSGSQTVPMLRRQSARSDRSSDARM